MSWPRDDAKLDRVRALMAEQELDVLVVRAPDNVLYLTNFWGMKGYDAVVFPREGDPVLICLEASEADAERTAWTTEVRLFHGYDESDPRPPGLRALDLARQLSSEYERVGIELSLGTQAADRMVGEPTTYPKAWFDAFPEAADATPLLAAARAIKTEQEVARMRLANEIAAGAMEHVQGLIRPGMRESEVGALWNGWVHDHGTGFEEGQGRARARLLARLVRPRDPHLHGHGQPRDPGARADALRDLGLRRRLLVRPHEEPRPGRARPALRRARAGAAGGLRGRDRLRLGRGRASPSSTGRSARAWPRSAIPGQPSHPICHGVGARAHEPPYAHQAGGGTIEAGMVLAIEPGVYWPEGGGLRVEDNFLITETGSERLCRFPDGIVRAG